MKNGNLNQIVQQNQNNFTNIYNRFLNIANNEKYQNKAFIIDFRINKKYTYKEVKEKSLKIAYELKNRGIKKGDKVALFIDNDPFWLISDLAIHAIGAINVARTGPKPELEHIVTHSDSKLLIYEEKYDIEFNNKINKKELEKIANSQIKQKKLENIININKPNELATIVYTSGTTDKPKGVMLTHENIIFDVDASLESLDKKINISDKDGIISLIPEWHMYQRMIEYIGMSRGATIYYDTIKHFKKESLFSKDITVISGVPSLWKNIKKDIEQKLKKSKLYHMLYNPAKNYILKKSKSKKTSLIENISYLIFNLTYGSMIRKRLGNKRILSSGGSYLEKDIEEFYATLKLPLLNGYGSTELSPITSIKIDNSELYSVGKPLKGIEVKLDDNNILLVKGKNVMKGYYKNSEETKKQIKDGYYITGDKFEIKNNTLYFKDRRKDVIVLENGENVSSRKLESIIENIDYINNAVVFCGKEIKNQKLGNGLYAIIDIDYKKYDSKKSNSDNTKTDILKEIKKEMNSKNLKKYEIIKNIFIYNKPFEIGSELTTTYKKKRENIVKKYFNSYK